MRTVPEAHLHYSIWNHKKKKDFYSGIRVWYFHSCAIPWRIITRVYPSPHRARRCAVTHNCRCDSGDCALYRQHLKSLRGRWTYVASLIPLDFHKHAKYNMVYNHHHWQSSPFWARAFLRRFCQICYPILTCLYFVTIFFFLPSKVVSLASNHKPGGPGSSIYILQWQGGPLITPGTGFPFRRLVRLPDILTRLHMAKGL
jgi:hypothetical protein